MLIICLIVPANMLSVPLLIFYFSYTELLHPIAHPMSIETSWSGCCNYTSLLYLSIIMWDLYPEYQ